MIRKNYAIVKENTVHDDDLLEVRLYEEEIGIATGLDNFLSTPYEDLPGIISALKLGEGDHLVKSIDGIHITIEVDEHSVIFRLAECSEVLAYLNVEYIHDLIEILERVHHDL